MRTDLKVALWLKNQKIRDPKNEVGEYVLFARVVSSMTLILRKLPKPRSKFATSLCEVSIAAKDIQQGWEGPFVRVEISDLTVYDFLGVIIELVEKHGFEIAPEGMLEFVKKWSQFQLSE